MTNNHSEENQQPSIRQEILSNSPVGGNLTMGNITQNINLTPPAQRHHNEKQLLQAVKEEVAARLKQSLHNAVLINLGKEAQPEQVKRSWSSDIKIGDKPSEPIPDDTSILKIFDQEEIAGKLLILGNPGAGKTTTMLDLAQALVVRSQENCDYPIPVLFNLSTWKDNKQSIRDWLILELKSKYGVRKDIGTKWVDDAKLLPMLDGLDELESVRQEPCVRKINVFLQSDSRPFYVVVCSRREEYEKVVRGQWEQSTDEDLAGISTKHNTRLYLNGAIILEPLEDGQIQVYLAQLNQLDLWKTLQLDAELLKLVQTPLFLSVLGFISLHKTLSLHEWKKSSSSESRRKYLLDVYWEAAIERELPYVGNSFPHDWQTKFWLIWLSKELQKEYGNEFMIESIQSSCIDNHELKKRFNLVVELITKIIIGLACGLVISLTDGLIHGIIIGVIVGITSIKPNPEIDTFEIIKWSLKRAKSAIYLALICWLISSPIVVFAAVMIGKNDKLIGALFLTFIFVLFAGLGVGFYAPEVEEKKFPNQGIWKSIMYAGIFGLVGGFSSALILGVGAGVIHGLTFGINIGFGSWLVLGTILGLSHGGTTCIQHFSLRIILYHNGYIPWNYAHFLDYCTERLLLQRVGGRYRFIHRLLQEHFAAMPLDK